MRPLDPRPERVGLASFLVALASALSRAQEDLDRRAAPSGASFVWTDVALGGSVGLTSDRAGPRLTVGTGRGPAGGFRAAFRHVDRRGGRD